MKHIVFATGALVALVGAAPQDDFSRTLTALRAGMRGEANGHAEQVKAAASALSAIPNRLQ